MGSQEEHKHDHSEHSHDHNCNHDHSGHSHDDKKDEEHCMYKGGTLAHEIFSHLPFSIFSVTIGIVIAGLICFMISDQMVEDANKLFMEYHEKHHDHSGHDHSGHDHSAHDHSGHDHSGHDHKEVDKAEKSHSHDDHNGPAIGFLFLFHLCHPAHILFSAIATTAMFYKYDKSLIKSIIVGSSGAIVFCTISDAIIPVFTARMIGLDAPYHLCILETPMKVIPFAFIGVLLGLASVYSGNTKSTITSHAVHVFASTMATLFFTIAYTGRLYWIEHIGTVFMMTAVAVGGICCLSDVIFPLMFTKEARKEYAKYGHEHPH